MHTLRLYITIGAIKDKEDKGLRKGKDLNQREIKSRAWLSLSGSFFEVAPIMMNIFSTFSVLARVPCPSL